MRVNINYSLLVHPVCLMLVFNEKCDVAPGAVQLYSALPHSVPAPACRCFQFYIVSRQIWISDLQPGTRGIRERLHVLTGDLVTGIDDSL